MTQQILRIAWRDLWRNPRRTLLTIAAIALGYTMLLLFTCLMEGFSRKIIETGTSLGLSHIQVHAPGYYPDRSIYQTLGGREQTDISGLLTLIAAHPQVRAASLRVYSHGLVGSPHHSAGVQIVGVMPAQEQKVTTLHTHVMAGSYVTEQIPKGVVVGDRLAKSVDAWIGSDIVLLAQAADGSIGNDLYTIVGIFHSGLEDMDRSLVLMSLSALQELLSLAPARVHEVGIALSDATEAMAVAPELEAQLEKTLPVQVQAWPELAPDLADHVQLNRRSTFILFCIVFLLAIMGITNTMLMAVFERTRELGMLMALGMRPLQVVGLILVEAMCLVGVSLVVGGGIAAPLLWYLHVHGLDLSSLMDEVSAAGAVIDPLWYGRQDFSVYSQAACGLAVTALVAAFYPALRAARFRPVEAMRKV